MPREIRRLETNVPQVVALAFDKGVPVEGRYGDQVRFTLVTDEIVYLDPPVAKRIEELGIRKGEDFQLCKREVKNGKSRPGVKVEVVKLGAAAPPAAKQEKAAAQPSTPASPGVQAQPSTNGKSNGTHVPMPFTGTGAGEFLLSALVNSVDIWLATQQYARTKGLELAVTSEDVRALAITAFINTRGR